MPNQRRHSLTLKWPLAAMMPASHTCSARPARTADAGCDHTRHAHRHRPAGASTRRRRPGLCQPAARPSRRRRQSHPLTADAATQLPLCQPVSHTLDGRCASDWARRLSWMHAPVGRRLSQRPFSHFRRSRLTFAAAVHTAESASCKTAKPRAVQDGALVSTKHSNLSSRSRSRSLSHAVPA